MTTITEIISMPTGPFQGTGYVGIVITNCVPSYFKLIGTDLDKITNITWYPDSKTPVEFITRHLILLNSTIGTFMIQVNNNFLDNKDRGGKISFRLDTGYTIAYPVKTFGPVSARPLWASPYEGLITG